MYYPGMPEAGDEEPAPEPAPGSGQTSAGSCYDFATHAVTCDVAEADCDGSHYAPGFIGGSGCCHCDSVECDHSKETSEEACSYYAMPEAGDEEPAPAPGDGQTSAGSCYDFATHAVTCDVAEAGCEYYYAPGYIGDNGCCHCDSV